MKQKYSAARGDEAFLQQCLWARSRPQSRRWYRAQSLSLKQRVELGSQLFGNWFTRRSTASPPSRASVSSHAQFDSTGSRMMRRPRRSMRICSASTRNACGKRTACDRPVQKTLAVSTAFCLSIRSMHLIHTNYAYCIFYIYWICYIDDIYCILNTPSDRQQYTTFGAAAISVKYFKAPAAAPSDDSRVTHRATTPSRRR